MDSRARNSSAESVVSLVDDNPDYSPEFNRLLKSGRVYESDGYTFYKLHVPIKLGDDTFSLLRFRRPKAKDQKNIKFANEGEINIILKMVYALCDVEQADGKFSAISSFATDELDLKDLQKVAIIIGNFSYEPPPT